jgi:hypothetical protein
MDTEQARHVQHRTQPFKIDRTTHNEVVCSMEANKNDALTLNEVKKSMIARTMFNTYEICYSFDSNENKYATPSDEVLKALFEWYDPMLPCYVGSKMSTDQWKYFSVRWMKEIMPRDVKKDHYVMRLSEADLAATIAFEVQARNFITKHGEEKAKML